MSYICIAREDSADVDTYEIDTPEGYAAARRALAEAGIAQADVYVGEPDGLGDSYKNGAVVFAMPSIAERILERLMGGDGCARNTRLGISVSKLIARIGSKGARDHLGNVYGYVFSDGSELECHGNGWDTPEGWASHA